MSIAYGGIVAFFFRGLNLLVALATVVITSHALGAGGRGVFFLGVTAVGIVAALTGGLTAAAAYQVSNQRREPGVVLLNGGVTGASLGAVAVVAGFAGTSVLSGEASSVSIAVGASSAAVILNSVLAGVFLGHGALVRYNLALVVPPFLSLTGITVVFYGLGRQTPESALAAFAVGQWLTLPFLALLGSRTGIVQRVRFEGTLARAILRFGLVAGISSGISFLNYRADSFVVQHFEGKSGVGVYSNAVYIAESVWQVSGSLALAAYARVGSLDQDAAADLTLRIMRHTLVILAAVALGLFLAAGLIVRVLFDPEFAGAASALRYLLPGVWLYGLAAAFSGYYTYQRGKPWAAAVVAGGGLAIDIAFAIVLVPRMGVNGAALASSIAYGVAMTGAVLVFARGTHRNPLDVLLFRRSDLEDYRTLVTRVRAVLARQGPAVSPPPRPPDGGG